MTEQQNRLRALLSNLDPATALSIADIFDEMIELVGMVKAQINPGFELAKRFYFSCKIEMNCPECKKPMVRDFSDDYLYYPVVGEIETHTITCRDCEESFDFKGVLGITYNYNPETLKRQ